MKDELLRKPKVEALIQARMSSSRLPGKVLMELGGMPAIMQVVRRVQASSLVDKVTVLTSRDESDDALVGVLNRYRVSVFRGPLEDVLDRFVQYIVTSNSDVYLRITGDCPLFDPEIIDQTIRFHIQGGWDYTSNTLTRTFPRGLDVEVFNARILPDLTKNQPDLSPSEREHATLAVYTRQNSYKVGSFFVDSNNSQHRWTLDTDEDYRFLFWLFEQSSHGSVLGLEELLNILKGTPEMIHLEP